MAGKTSWEIDPAHTTIEFAVKHMMFTTVRGRMNDLSGTIHADESNPNHSDVSVQIKTASIDTGNTDRDTHLKSGDFLDVENYPLITFRSKRVDGAYKKEGDRFKLTGDLTIRDTTKEITLDCTFQGIGKDPWGGTRAGFSAETKIDRRDWGLKWNQALETGGVLVANELRVQIDVQAVKQAAATDVAA
jgi:polyisoprenoid-binding protein YceI